MSVWSSSSERIAELEWALRALLEHDDARFGWEGEPSKVEKRCREILERPHSPQFRLFDGQSGDDETQVSAPDVSGLTSFLNRRFMEQK